MAYINGSQNFMVALGGLGSGGTVFIRYSVSEDGSNFTETWSEGQNYIGFATGKTAPTDKSEYTWSRFVSLSTGEVDPSTLYVTCDGEGNVTLNGAIVEAEDLPTFDLVALGLPILPLSGESVSVETDTTEIAAALKKGIVKFKVARSILAGYNYSVTEGFTVGGATAYDGVPYVCYCHMGSFAYSLTIESGKITARYIKNELPTSIDMSAFDTEGKIVETYSDGLSQTTTIEVDGNGNPVKITDGRGHTTKLTW